MTCTLLVYFLQQFETKSHTSFSLFASKAPKQENLQAITHYVATSHHHNTTGTTFVKVFSFVQKLLLNYDLGLVIKIYNWFERVRKALYFIAEK